MYGQKLGREETTATNLNESSGIDQGHGVLERYEEFGAGDGHGVDKVLAVLDHRLHVDGHNGSLDPATAVQVPQ
jgi:hypothetical protein